MLFKPCLRICLRSSRTLAEKTLTRIGEILCSLLGSTGFLAELRVLVDFISDQLPAEHLEQVEQFSSRLVCNRWHVFYLRVSTVVEPHARPQ